MFITYFLQSFDTEAFFEFYFSYVDLLQLTSGNDIDLNRYKESSEQSKLYHGHLEIRSYIVKVHLNLTAKVKV